MFAAATLIRSLGKHNYYNLWTGFYSAKNILRDTPRAVDILLSLGKTMFASFATHYLIPAFGLLLPAVFLFAIGLKGVWKRPGRFLKFLEDPKREKKFLAIVFIVTLSITLIIRLWVVGTYPLISDEFSYLFEADLIAHGKIYAKSPPMPRFFRTQNIVNDGKWYSKYTIGWPLLLAGGKLLGIEWAVAPLCAAVSVLLLYLAAKAVLGKEEAFIAVIFLIVSPFFVLMSCTYFPHTASGMFTLALIYFMFKSFDSDSTKYTAGAGFSLLMLILIRPADAALVAMGLIPTLIYYLDYKNPVKFVKRYIPTVALAALGVAVLALVNKAQTGDPLLFAFIKHTPEEKWGFGTFGHNPLRGLWDFFFAMLRGSFWVAPFLTLLSLFFLFSPGKQKKECRFLAVPILFFVLFYFAYYSGGILEIGPRFYYPAFLILLFLASGGVFSAQREMEELRLPGYSGFALSVLLLTSLFTAVGVLVPCTIDVGRQYVVNSRPVRKVHLELDVKPPALVFLRDNPDGENAVLNRNWFDYQNADQLLALYLTPPENQKLIDKFPERNVYMVVYDRKKAIRVLADEFNNSPTSANYFYGGLNYWQSVLDRQKAEKAFLKANSLAPDNPRILWNLGNLYFSWKKYEKAADVFKQLSSHPQMGIESLYFWGRSLGESGDRKKAVRILRFVADNSGNNFYALKAKNWLEYYEKGK